MYAIKTNTGKEIMFLTYEEAYKYASFDETIWPCEICDPDGNTIIGFS